MKTVLIKGANVYAPQDMGQCDVLAINDKIAAIKPEINPDSISKICDDAAVIEGNGCYVFPGLIDHHVHFNGAGGTIGPRGRTIDTPLSTLTLAGITTAIALLGSDGIWRNVTELLQKAIALEEEGISTYIYTGAYQMNPTPTATGSVRSDIILIDKCLGTKIAISDNRSNNPTVENIIQVATDTRIAGMLAGKAGVVMTHIGVGKAGLEPLFEAVKRSDIPIGTFLPTHLNRSSRLVEEAIAFAKQDGYVDISTAVSPKYGFGTAKKPSECIKYWLEKGVPADRITVSSDGNGAMAVIGEGGAVVGMTTSYIPAHLEEFADSILVEKLPIETVLKVFNTNVANHLKLDSKNGIAPGRDADLIVMTKGDLKLRDVIAKGQVMVRNGEAVIHGTFGDNLA
ncbi:MAG: beta-aspartyl-peptidase [Synergistaceae bacterium]|nr:beta-aspartyl-peptidase [Synergistaceae bacterium]